MKLIGPFRSSFTHKFQVHFQKKSKTAPSLIFQNQYQNNNRGIQFIMNYIQDRQQFDAQYQKRPVTPIDGFLIKRKYQLEGNADSMEFHEKIQTISGLRLKNLVPVSFIKSQGIETHLYYECFQCTLEIYLVNCDQDQIKSLHRQFIELAIGLAKAGIVTTFDSLRCGLLVEPDEAIVKYYLLPEEAIFAGDLKYIQESVSLFSLQALQYMKNRVQKLTEPTLLNSLSEKCLTQSILKEDSPRMTIDDKMVQSKRTINEADLRPPKKFEHKNSLRKLSVLSKQLTEISARHKARRNTQNLVSFSTKMLAESRISNERMTQFSDQSVLSNSGNIQKKMIDTAYLIARTKRAQKALSSINQRMMPYLQILKILQSMKSS